MTQFRDPEAEHTLLAALDASEAGEPQGDAFAVLARAGGRVETHEITLFTSVPLDADVRVHADGAREARRIAAAPAAFSRATGDDRVEGRLVLDAPAREGSRRGAIVLTVEETSPDTVYENERRGALAQIFVSPRDHARRQSATTITGTPTHDTVTRRPRTPVVWIAPEDGAELAREAASGGLTVSIASRLREGWEPAVFPVAEIRGGEDPDEFVLVHGTDAAALARIAGALHAGRRVLKRSVRAACWPCAAFSGNGAAAWYADTFAQDLDRQCVAHVVVPDRDLQPAGLPGVAWMAEAAELCLDAINDAGAERVSGRRPQRPEYPFNQIGVTGLFGGRRFERDLQAMLLAVCRTANAPLHPFDYTAAVLEIGAAIQRYQAAAERELNLGPISRELGELRRAVGAWQASAAAAVAAHPGDAGRRRRLNARLRRLARAIVPLGYARGERFDHDPAVRYSAVPRLEAALHLKEAADEMKPFIRTALQREQNKILSAIDDARQCIT